MQDNRDRIVIIGASSGIGLETLEFANARGLSIVATYSKHKQPVVDAVKRLNIPQSSIDIIEADIRTQAGVDSLLHSSKSKYSVIKSVVNCAGGNTRRNLGDIRESDISESLAINLTGALLVSQTFGLYMKNNGGGAIVHIASTAGLRPLGRSHHYVASKGGLVAMIPALAMSLGPEVRINAVAPGTLCESDGSRVDAFKSPLMMLPSAGDIAEGVMFLLSNRAITGHVLPIDAGLTIGGRYANDA